MQNVKGNGFVNSDYIISSLRQQMLAAHCFLTDSMDQAEYVAEVRVGALGTDSHDVTYGIPASSGLSNAASLVPNAPAIPMIPEISLAKKADEEAAAKIAVFAYHRDTREAVWQSGLCQARSSAKDTWLFGAGPFQSGTIHDKTRFAGEALEIPLLPNGEQGDSVDPLALYGRRFSFVQPPPKKAPPTPPENQVQQAAHQEPAAQEAKATPAEGAKSG